MKAVIAITLIGAACAALLVVTDTLTRSDIEKQRQARARALAESLLERPLPDTVNPSAAQFGNCPNWLFRQHQVDGYAGAIGLLAFYQAGGLSLRVTEHRETPGIGDFIDHARNPWLTKLDRATLEEWQNLDSVSGATITSDAIRRAAVGLYEILPREVASCDV